MEPKLVKATNFQAREIEDLQTIYTNSINVSASNMDFTFDFGYFPPNRTIVKDGQTVIPVDIKVRVIMSPQHAKLFANLLITNIQQYESGFGEIHTEPKQKGNA
jgi:hypothetical protein